MLIAHEQLLGHGCLDGGPALFAQEVDKVANNGVTPSCLVIVIFCAGWNAFAGDALFSASKCDFSTQSSTKTPVVGIWLIVRGERAADPFLCPACFFCCNIIARNKAMVLRLISARALKIHPKAAAAASLTAFLVSDFVSMAVGVTSCCGRPCSGKDKEKENTCFHTKHVWFSGSQGKGGGEGGSRE